MKKFNETKVISVILCIMMVIAVLPAAVFAEDNGVAKINSSTYTKLDDAIKAAKDGDTIQLINNAETNGIELKKNIKILGELDENKNPKYTISFVDKGIALWGKSLTFEKCNVEMKGIGSTPYTSEWNWQTICASKDSSLTLIDTTMLMNGENAGNAHAIYFCSNNKLNLTNSSLTIKNYSDDALEWNGGDGGYNVNLKDSTFISDNNRSGFTGTFYATFDNSIVNVLNSRGNGSNGTYYIIKNKSKVTFDGNGAWGISAWRIDMTDGAILEATNNGYSGIWTRVINADSTCTLNIEGNGTKAPSSVTNAGILFYGNKEINSSIEKGAKVIIRNNAGSGIRASNVYCNLSIGSATIVNNGTGKVNGKLIDAEKGGGVYNLGTIVLDKDEVFLYNNHASQAGDDIYVEKSGTIEFGDTGTDWYLDGMPDCNGEIHKIDGWYDDPEESRWEAHDEEKLYVEKRESGRHDGIFAAKAAHGINFDGKAGNSKIAENLVLDTDGTYTSEISLKIGAETKGKYNSVDAGSYVEDYMGYTDEYNFDFENSADKLSLTVGETVYEAIAVDDQENTYGFGEKLENGDYSYVLTYTPGEKKADEYFKLIFNVPVEKEAPVTLKYTVRLTNPETIPGIYGEYDADGSSNTDGSNDLRTNNKAVLYAKSTDKNVTEITYPMPTVSYTVEAEKDSFYRPLTAIIVYDRDPAGNPIGGAEFELRYENGVLYSTKTTSDSKGRITFDKIVAGTRYYVVQTGAPEGYAMDTTRHYITAAPYIHDNIINVTNEITEYDVVDTVEEEPADETQQAATVTVPDKTAFIRH